jgi:hypothetical protein
MESLQCVCRSLLCFMLFVISNDEPEGNGVNNCSFCPPVACSFLDCVLLLLSAATVSVFMPERHLAGHPTGVTRLHSCSPAIEATEKTNFVVISTWFHYNYFYGFCSKKRSLNYKQLVIHTCRVLILTE